jgi:hypothetical protein
VSEQSATRQQLEMSIRALLPDDLSLRGPEASQKPTVAAVGIGGVMTGYAWGRLRSRKIRRRKKKEQKEKQREKQK